MVLAATVVLAATHRERSNALCDWQHAAYQENRVARLGEDAAKPHRIHRKLTRD